MPNIIQLLPDNIANQIAAGEVIQRPASVVKELLENSIDAKSTSIKIIIKDAGSSLIQVIDNGIGMSEIDARMCFENHATSKISSAEDLFNLKTMGFRGEALASIASIAQVELESCDLASQIGTKIIIEGAKIKNQTSTVTNHGTKISVKNIFFNIPARRRFLKSASLETKHILDEFIRIALSHPHIEFFLYQDTQELYHLSVGKLSHRIIQLFGENYKNQLIPCEEKNPFITIKGFIGKPTYAKKTRGDQFIFVNNRFIKNHNLAHAIKTAYGRLILPEVFPFYAIFINIEPQLIDVNVHPNKTEIKFEDDSLIYSILNSVVKKSLSIYQVAPTIDFSVEANFNLIKPPQFQKNNFISRKEHAYSQLKNFIPQTKNQKNEIISTWNSLLQNAEETNFYAPNLFHSQINDTSQNSNITKKGINDKIIQILGRYIIFQTKDSIILIDQCTTHKKILYEEYLNYLISTQNKMQNLLFPERIPLSPTDFLIIKEYQNDLFKIGFEIEIFGKSEIIVISCPIELQNVNLKETIESILENIKWNKKNLSIKEKENIAISAANSTAMKPGKLLEKQEMESLIERLFSCSNPNYTADGLKTFVSLSITDIENLFQ